MFSWPIGWPILNFFWGYLADFCDFTMIFLLIFARGEAGCFASVVDPTETPYMYMRSVHSVHLVCRDSRHAMQQPSRYNQNNVGDFDFFEGSLTNRPPDKKNPGGAQWTKNDR